MALGVDSALATIKDVESVALHGIKLARDSAAGGLHWGQVLGDIIKLAVDARTLAADAPLALPELKDLQAEEVAALGAAAYNCVVSVMAAVNAA